MFTSRVVVSSFLGIDEFEDEIEKIVWELLEDIAKLGSSDPVVIMGFTHLIDKGFTKKHRRYS